MFAEISAKKHTISHVVSSRTRLLFCVATLAPSLILLFRLDVVAVRLDSPLGLAWVEPGFLIYAMVIFGIASLVAAIVSFVMDLRRAKQQ